jgi:hypothetical protein
VAELSARPSGIPLGGLEGDRGRASEEDDELEEVLAGKIMNRVSQPKCTPGEADLAQHPGQPAEVSRGLVGAASMQDELVSHGIRDATKRSDGMFSLSALAQGAIMARTWP